jgi:transcriptional regulator GlxA family with amidase domain
VIRSARILAEIVPSLSLRPQLVPAIIGRMTSPRRVWFVAFDGCQSLDVTGPLEVFAIADRLAGGGHYSTEIVAPPGDVVTTSGLRIVPHCTIDATPDEPIDSLIVAGGLGVHAAARNPDLVDWIRRTQRRTRRIASVCTGAYLLAASGVLDGRRATTHWASAEHLAQRHPAISVEPDRIYVRDGNVWTSAGVTAGMDLALALVEADHGREAALEVARWLVVYVQRPGGQSQFSAPLAAQLADRAPVREAQEHVLADPATVHTVESLADGASMSVRHFARAFKAEVGMTPATYVEAVRVERARHLLETAATTLDEVATACGFGTPETFRRAFRRRLGVSPGEYRERFRAAA